MTTHSVIVRIHGKGFSGAEISPYRTILVLNRRDLNQQIFLPATKNIDKSMVGFCIQYAVAALRNADSD
jgi:hypothetical protein